MPKISKFEGIKLNFCTNEVIPKVLLAKDLAYLGNRKSTAKTWHRTWVMHLSLHFIHLLFIQDNSFKSSVCREEVRREEQQWVSAAICKTQWRLCHGLGMHFSKWCWNHQKSIRFFSDPKHTSNSVKANLARKACNETHWSSVGSSSQRTEGSQHPKKSFEWSSRGLQNFSWRLLKEITRKQESSVQIGLYKLYTLHFHVCLHMFL